MCGRFAQSQTREDYLALLAEDIERDIPYDPEPIGRYNVAPGTKVLLLSERDEHLHLDVYKRQSLDSTFTPLNWV